MDAKSVFHEEWLRSLREQYKHVVRNDDRVTLSSLTAVMQNVGFRKDELAQLRIEATMHVDDVGADFSADMNILEASKASQAHPAECVCPDCATVDESQFDADGQPLATDPELQSHESGSLHPAADINAVEAPDESQSLTFEDSVAAETLPSAEAEPEPADDEAGDEIDPEAPEQMSLF